MLSTIALCIAPLSYLLHAVLQYLCIISFSLNFREFTADGALESGEVWRNAGVPSPIAAIEHQTRQRFYIGQPTPFCNI